DLVGNTKICAGLNFGAVFGALDGPFHTEFAVFVERDFGENHLNEDLGHWLIELFDQSLEFFEITGTGTEKKRVANRLSNDRDFAFELLLQVTDHAADSIRGHI